MKKRSTTVLAAQLVLAVGFLLATLNSGRAAAQGAPARLIPFQARLTDGNGQPLADGVYTLLFNIYDTPTGGTACWTETQNTVSVIGGQVNVLLGSLTSLDDPNNDGSQADAIGSNPAGSGAGACQGAGARFLGITAGANGQEMVPRQQLVPAFHARLADIANALPNGAITSGMIAAGAVTTDRIAPGAVTTDRIEAGAVTTDRIGSGAVTTDRIAPGTIVDANLSSGLQAELGAIVPIGTVLPYAGTIVPPGGTWLPCDGRQLQQQTYPALFQAIGTTYNPAAQAGTFNLPDLRGRGPIGNNADQIDRSLRSLGDVGGEETHTLSIDEMPSHYHQQTRATAFGGLPALVTAGNGDGGQQGTSQFTGPAGGGLAHNNMQPFIVLSFIMKVQ